MNKMGKRFMALLVVFTSIISFLPVGFGGQAANAAADPTAVKVYINSNKDQLTPRTDTTTNEEIYTTQATQDTFDITVEDLRVAQDIASSETELIKQVSTNGKSASGIVNQKLEIISVNGTSWQETDGKNILKGIGIDVVDSENPNSSAKRIGQTITGLPLGVNKIKYKITVTKQIVDYVPAVKDASGTVVTPAGYKVNDPVETPYASQQLTIEHATGFVVNKIDPMIFKAYIGKQSDLDSATYKENNTVPFSYTTTAKPDSNMPLRYIFDVPDSISTLEYNMTFDNTMVLDDAQVYKNGALDTSYNITGQTLTGNLEKLDQTDTIVVKLNSSTGEKNIQKAYAIEIRYNKLNSDKDFSLKNAGITKLDYNDADSVSAYIGKKFIGTTDDNDILTYTGDIHIDPKATMISIDPTLVRSKDTVAYVVTNNYVDSTGIKKVKKSVLKNGKQFIDFMASTTSNQLQVDVYEGTNGNATDTSKPLARYLLNVTLDSTDTFALDLNFKNKDGGSDGVYLTQPGVKANTIDEFSTDRRTYDLYSSDPVKVSFALKSEDDKYTGIRSSKNEYIKVWLADTVNSNNLTEAQASKDNILDSNNMRKTSLDVALDGAKKIVVQAYYDDFNETTTGAAAYVSNEVGDKYIFYLPNNYDSTNTTTTGEDSTNATLNSLKLTDGTLVDSDGNTGFSSDVLDYAITVPKNDTTAKITATAQDDNVKSIVATIEGSDTTYDLVSGQASNLHLDADGSTTVNIAVTAQDGTTIKKYTLVIKNNSKSSNVNLKNVILNTGDYTFNSTNGTTKVRVTQGTTSIKVTPVPDDSNSTVTVDGTEYTGSTITVSLKGAQETDIKIVVKSEDGTESKTYALQVYRTDSANWNDSSDSSVDLTQDDQYYDEYNECWVDTTKYEEWGTIGSKPAYFDKNNRQVKDAWISTGQKFYYLNSSGYRASGWKVDDADGKTYYLDPTTGEMRKGWMNLNNSWYYLGLNGVMHKGWLSLNQKWYYFTPNGQMVISQSMFIDDKVYNFGQDGAIYS